jgi:hypothetical protein
LNTGIYVCSFWHQTCVMENGIGVAQRLFDSGMPAYQYRTQDGDGTI